MLVEGSGIDAYFTGRLFEKRPAHIPLVQKVSKSIRTTTMEITEVFYLNSSIN